MVGVPNGKGTLCVPALRPLLHVTCLCLVMDCLKKDMHVSTAGLQIAKSTDRLAIDCCREEPLPRSAKPLSSVSFWQKQLAHKMAT